MMSLHLMDYLTFSTKEIDLFLDTCVSGYCAHDCKCLQPIERPDPVTTPVENHDQVIKAHLSKEVLKGKQGPTIEELSKMFFTTKHRWYPVGQ